MELKKLDKRFSICKIKNFTSEIADLLKDEFCFIGKTDEELSLVCEYDHLPSDVVDADNGWKAFRIQGILDFSLIGILAPIADILAEGKIGIFAVSTFNTDYVLVKEEKYEDALQLLAEHGYKII